MKLTVFTRNVMILTNVWNIINSKLLTPHYHYILAGSFSIHYTFIYIHLHLQKYRDTKLFDEIWHTNIAFMV